MSAKKGLGSLAALMDEAAAPVGEQEIDLELIHEDPDQPRKDMDPAALKDLAASIESQGVVQPIVVRVHPEITGHYMIVAGERRWLASQRAGKTTIPAVVREVSNETIRAMQIVENVQREALRPMQEAAAVEQLVGALGGKAQVAAVALGKSASWVSKRRKLLKLPEAVQRYADGPGATRDVELLALLGELYELAEARAVRIMHSPEGPTRERVIALLERLREPKKAPSVPVAVDSPKTPNLPQGAGELPEDLVGGGQGEQSSGSGPVVAPAPLVDDYQEDEDSPAPMARRTRQRRAVEATEPDPITDPVVLVQHEGDVVALVLTQAAAPGQVWIEYRDTGEQALVLANALVVVGVVQAG